MILVWFVLQFFLLFSYLKKNYASHQILEISTRLSIQISSKCNANDLNSKGKEFNLFDIKCCLGMCLWFFFCLHDFTFCTYLHSLTHSLICSFSTILIITIAMLWKRRSLKMWNWSTMEWIQLFNRSGNENYSFFPLHQCTRI